MRAVGHHAPTVPAGSILKDLRLGDKVHHIEAEARHAAVAPEAHHIHECIAHLGVCPIEVRLAHIVHVQVPFAQARLPLPGAPAKGALPVGGRFPRVAGARASPPVAQDVEALVALIASKRPLEPGVLHGGMAEHHVEHDAEASRSGLAHKLVEIVHRSVDRIYRAVIRDVIAVVALRGGEERRDPHIVDSQRGQVVELRGDARQVADAIAIAVAKALDVDLIDDRLAQVAFGSCHRAHAPLSYRCRACRRVVAVAIARLLSATTHRGTWAFKHPGAPVV